MQISIVMLIVFETNFGGDKSLWRKELPQGGHPLLEESQTLMENLRIGDVSSPSKAAY